MSTLTGANFIGSRESREGSTHFRVQDPTTGADLDPEFVEATPEEVEAAVRAADGAFGVTGAIDAVLPV